MTENQWPQDGSPTAPPATQRTSGTQSPTPGPGTDASTPEMIKDEAGNVAGQAKDSAANVVETAKTEASNVASEAKTNAKDLLEQAKADITDQAAKQQQKVASGLRSISKELDSMTAAPEQPGVATDLVRQAAERSSSVAAWLEDREPGSLLEELKTFARRRPGAFLLLAAGAGVLAGRLGRSLGAGGNASARTAGPGIPSPATGGQAPGGFTPAAGRTVPPPAVQLPGPEVTTAGYAGGGTTPLEEIGPADTAYPPVDDPLTGSGGPR